MTEREKRFLCRTCRHVFDHVVDGEGPSWRGIACPICRSDDIVEAPPWAPLGSGWNIYDSNKWEYECQDCRHTFKMPIPKSPTEEEARRCPECHSGHLHRMTSGKGLPLHCG